MKEHMTRVVVNGKYPGVKVWDSLRGDAIIVFNLSYNFGPQYPVVLEDDGVRATLGKSGRDYEVFLPWASIMVMDNTLPEGVSAFPLDMPREVKDMLVAP